MCKSHLKKVCLQSYSTTFKSLSFSVFRGAYCVQRTIINFQSVKEVKSLKIYFLSFCCHHGHLTDNVVFFFFCKNKNTLVCPHHSYI